MANNSTAQNEPTHSQQPYFSATATRTRASAFRFDLWKEEKSGLGHRESATTCECVRFSCNLYSRFFQCKILIYVHPQKTTIPALFWTVLVSVDQEFL